MRSRLQAGMIAFAGDAPPAELTASASVPSARRKWRSHARVTSGSAKSALFRITTRGFCRTMVRIIGFRLAVGMRASRSSMTTSISFSFSSICRRARVMWPGNH